MHFPYIAFFIMSIVSLDYAKMATIFDIAAEGASRSISSLYLLDKLLRE